MKKYAAVFKQLAVTAGIAFAVIGIAFSGSPSAASAAEARPFAHEARDPAWFAVADGKAGNAALLSLLKTDAATLENDLRSGLSLADIAKRQGVDKQKVIDLLVEQQKQRLDEAVKAGKLTEKQAAEWKNGIEERTRKIVDGEFRRGHGHRGRHSARKLEDTAEVLGMSADALVQEMKKGKSIAQIGKEKGLSEDQLVAKLLAKEKTRIQEQIHRVWGKASDAKNG